MTPEQANTEILQRVTRIETMCEGRCEASHESRHEGKVEIARIQTYVEHRIDRLEEKIDKAVAALEKKTERINERQWTDRLKSAGGLTGAGGIGALIIWIIQAVTGGGGK